MREVRRRGGLALDEREWFREDLGHLGGRGRADAALGRCDGVGAREVECCDGGGVAGLGRGEGNGLPRWGKDSLRVVEGVRALGRVGAVQVLIIPEKPVSDASLRMDNANENDRKSKMDRYNPPALRGVETQHASCLTATSSSPSAAIHRARPQRPKRVSQKRVVA